MGRPSPAPPASRVRASSRRTRRSKMRSRSAGGTPGPSSTTSTHRPRPSRAPTSRRTVPLGAAVPAGVLQEVGEDLRDPPGVGVHGRRRRRSIRTVSDGREEGDAVGLGGGQRGEVDGAALAAACRPRCGPARACRRPARPPAGSRAPAWWRSARGARGRASGWRTRVSAERLHAADRGAQLVRGVGEEPPGRGLGPPRLVGGGLGAGLRGLERVEHGVEGCGGAAELGVGAGRVQASAAVAGGDVAGEAGHGRRAGRSATRTPPSSATAMTARARPRPTTTMTARSRARTPSFSPGSAARTRRVPSGTATTGSRSARRPPRAAVRADPVRGGPARRHRAAAGHRGVRASAGDPRRPAASTQHRADALPADRARRASGRSCRAEISRLARAARSSRRLCWSRRSWAARVRSTATPITTQRDRDDEHDDAVTRSRSDADAPPTRAATTPRRCAHASRAGSRRGPQRVAQARARCARSAARAPRACGAGR